MNKVILHEMPKVRGTVPKPVKNRLWDTTFGSAAGEGACYVCRTIINSKDFEAGHIKAASKGGPSTVKNLRCICSTCNKSMGTQNLEIFKAIYFPDSSFIDDNKDCTCKCLKKNTTKTKVVSETGFVLKKKLGSINYFEYCPKKILFDEEIEEQIINNIKSFDKYVYKG